MSKAGVLGAMDDHGEAAAEDVTIPWIISGHGIWARRELLAPVHITDTAPTIAALLGLTAPHEWQGRVVSAALV